MFTLCFRIFQAKRNSTNFHTNLPFLFAISADQLYARATVKEVLELKLEPSALRELSRSSSSGSAFRKGLRVIQVLLGFGAYAVKMLQELLKDISGTALTY